MKKLFFLFSLIPIILNAQNSEPVQARFAIPAKDQTNQLLNGNHEYFLQKSYLRGNHWDSSPRLDKAVGYNQKDIYNDQYIGNDALKLNDGTLLHVKMKYIKQGDTYYTSYWTHCLGPDILNARGIEYSPILEINPSLTNTVQTCTTSTRNPVFGFQTVKGVISNNSQDENYSLLQLFKSDNQVLNQTVLADNWPNDQIISMKGNINNISDIAPYQDPTNRKNTN